jgi:type I restriction enzyme S subunit
VPTSLDGEIASTGFAVLRPANGVEPRYLFYKAISRDFVAALTGEQYGVSYPAVRDEQVRAQPFELPPTNEQSRIVAKIEELFSELDKGIESLTTAREQLKVYRQSILKDAFEGRLTADWRKEHPEKLRTADEILTDVLNARAEKTGRSLVRVDLPDFQNLSPLPKGWTYLPFEAVACSIRNGISKKPNETGALKIFRISAVRPMEFDMADFRHIDDEPEFHSFKLRRGDVVFTRYNGSRAYVGVAAVFHSDEAFVYPDKLIRCDVQSLRIDPGYIEKAVNCGESRAFIESRIRTTAGQAGISGGDLKVMPIPICSIEEQQQINAGVEAQLTAVARLDREIMICL